MNVDLALQFANHACESREDRMPAGGVARTKALILDTLGAGFAGSAAPGVSEGLQWVRETGGAPQARVLVHGDRLPATAAALINGTMCAARDFDPVHEAGVLLPYGPIFAAGLAAAELSRASGKALLHAVILGTDLTCRIGKALKGGLGWSRTATLGVFGAALASAKLLRLDPGQTVDALGLALSRSSGNIQTVIDGSLAKRYQAGFTAEAGLTAALLASRGVTGPANVFEGRCGYFALYENGRYSRDEIVAGLGEHFEGAEASIKPYPCAREHHGAIAAALQLRAGGVRAADVRSVVVTLPPNAFALSGKPFLREGRRSVGDAISSAAYGVAVALLRGEVTLGDFEPAALARAEVLDLAARIELRADASIADAKALVPQSVTLTLAQGGQRSARLEAMPGSAQMPLPDAELERKFASCLAHSARPVTPERAAALADFVRHLDQKHAAADLGELACAS